MLIAAVTTSAGWLMVLHVSMTILKELSDYTGSQMSRGSKLRDEALNVAPSRKHFHMMQYEGLICTTTKQTISPRFRDPVCPLATNAILFTAASAETFSQNARAEIFQDFLSCFAVCVYLIYFSVRFSLLNIKEFMNNKRLKCFFANIIFFVCVQRHLVDLR